MEGILVYVQIFHKRIPVGVGEWVPPRSPGDEGVEAGDELRGLPDGCEGRFDAGVGAKEPGGVGVAAAVLTKKPIEPLPGQLASTQVLGSLRRIPLPRDYSHCQKRSMVWDTYWGLRRPEMTT
jgi:hypothetical protein